MPVDELAALLRVVTVIADLDPATAWELDTQLEGMTKVTAAFAESLVTWGERLAEIGLHDSVTAAAGTGSDHLSQTAAAFAAARRNLRTVYAAQFAAAEAQVSQVERRDFWGETPSGAAAGPSVPAGASAPAAGDGPAADQPVDETTEVQSGAMNLPNGVYMDWSCTTDDGGRQLELGDGADAVNLDLGPAQLRELRQQLAWTVFGDERAEDHVAFGDDDGYIDWSTPLRDAAGLPVDGRRIEIGDGDGNAVSIDLRADELRALYEQLAEDIDNDTSDAEIEKNVRVAYAAVIAREGLVAGHDYVKVHAIREQLGDRFDPDRVGQVIRRMGDEPGASLEPEILGSRPGPILMIEYDQEAADQAALLKFRAGAERGDVDDVKNNELFAALRAVTDSAERDLIQAEIDMRKYAAQRGAE